MTDQHFPGLREILFLNPRKRPDVLEREVDEQLRLMVRHAYDHVPFYREQWNRAGFDPNDFSGRKDLPAIPMVDKSIIVAAGQAALDGRASQDKMFTMSTSGTSGCTIHAQRTLHEMRASRRAYLRSLIKAGARPWHRTMTVCSPWLHAKRGNSWRKFLKRITFVRNKQSANRSTHCILSGRTGWWGRPGGFI